jgi:hypothetical protein
MTQRNIQWNDVQRPAKSRAGRFADEHSLLRSMRLSYRIRQNSVRTPELL